MSGINFICFLSFNYLNGIHYVEHMTVRSEAIYVKMVLAILKNGIKIGKYP